MTGEGGPRVAGLILAAGRGTRFGPQPKLLAPLDGRPLVRHAAEAARAGGLDPVLIVVGHEAARVRAALSDLDLVAVENPDFAAGLSTSLRAGFAALPPGVEAAVVLLGDMPRVGPGLIAELVAAYGERRRPPAAVIPVAGGRRGNPVLLDRASLAAAIAGLEGDQGAGPLLRGRDDVLEVAFDDPGALLDVDTPDALTDLRAEPPRG